MSNLAKGRTREGRLLAARLLLLVAPLIGAGVARAVPAGRFLALSYEGDPDLALLDTAVDEVSTQVEARRTARLPLGAAADDGRGDEISPDGRLRLVPRPTSDELAIEEAEGGAAIATLSMPAGPRAVAFASDGRRAYVACERAGVIAVVDLERRRTEAPLPLDGGAQPVALLVAHDGRTLFVVDGGRPRVSALNLGSGLVTGTVDDVEARPGAIALSSDGAKLYAAPPRQPQVTVVDLLRFQVTKRIPLPRPAARLAPF